MSIGAAVFKWNVSAEDIEVSKTYCRTPRHFGCSQEIETVGLHFMSENNINFPLNFQEARRLYDTLLEFIDDLESWEICK